MKKLTKFFLLTLCTGSLFLGFSNAQNQESSYENEGNSYTDNGNTNINSEFNSGNQHQRDSPRKTSEELNIDIGAGLCTCGINMLGYLLYLSLFSIKILLGIIVIITSLKTMSLYKSFVNKDKYARLFNIPIINLHPLSKITIGRIRFYVLMLLLGFFVYSIYTDKAGCCYRPTRQRGAGIIAGIFSTIILGFLLSKLSYLTKSSQKASDKEPSNK